MYKRGNFYTNFTMYKDTQESGVLDNVDGLSRLHFNFKLSYKKPIEIVRLVFQRDFTNGHNDAFLIQWVPVNHSNESIHKLN